MLKVLLPVIVVAAGGTALYPALRHHEHHDPQAKQPLPPLTVRYEAGAPATAAVAQPSFEVVNTAENSVRLGDVAIRYYFTADGAPSYAFNCVRASVGCSNVTGRIVALADPTATADHYLQIGFTAGAGTLAAGAKSGAVALQLYRPDGKQADQRNDRSFDAANTTFRASPLVTGYLRGVHVWGDEPDGGRPATSAPGSPAQASPARGSATQGSSAQGSAAPPAVRPAPPRGIVFDDFHYSGPGDPALHAHGWLVRTSAGGPGIPDTWSADGISFPAERSAESGQVLQLRAGTDGTPAGTAQSEVQSSGTAFLTGTYAARIYFNDKPTSGRNGDPINESFYMISPDNSRYSELDNEYQPNGGWGAPGPRFGTTSWHSATQNERATHQTMTSLQGWHTLVITAVHGVVTYSLDGRELFRSKGAYFPREAMSVNFNTWFVNLPFPGPRTWDMQVNWFYYQANQAQSLPQVRKAVTSLYDTGTDYVNTVPAS